MSLDQTVLRFSAAKLTQLSSRIVDCLDKLDSETASSLIKS